MEIEVNERYYNCLLDTGSDVSIFPYTMVKGQIAANHHGSQGGELITDTAVGRDDGASSVERSKDWGTRRRD